LTSVHDDGAIRSDAEGVNLRATKLYDFCDPTERGEWLDIVIALINYLRSGNSRVGHLNNHVAKSMLHKDEMESQATESQAADTEVVEDESEEDQPENRDVPSTIIRYSMLILAVRRSTSKKRRLENTRFEGNTKRMRGK